MRSRACHRGVVTVGGGRLGSEKPPLDLSNAFGLQVENPPVVEVLGRSAGHTCLLGSVGAVELQPHLLYCFVLALRGSHPHISIADCVRNEDGPESMT